MSHVELQAKSNNESMMMLNAYKLPSGLSSALEQAKLLLWTFAGE